MDHQAFIGKKIRTTQGGEGIVTEFGDTYVTIRFLSEEKSYAWAVGFKNKFLSFLDENLNQIIQDELDAQDLAVRKHAEEIETKKKSLADRKERLQKEYEKLLSKNQAMKVLFGSDFLYPPYIEFMKEYGRVVEKKDIESLFKSLFRKAPYSRYVYGNWYYW